MKNHPAHNPSLFPSRLVARAIAVIALAAGATPAVAAPPQRLSFSAAVARAAQSPEQRARADALRARRAGDRHITGAIAGGKTVTVYPSLRVLPSVGPELQVYAGQSFAINGRGAARRGAARAERAVLAAAADAALLSRQLAVADAWIELWTAQNAAPWLGRERTLAAQALAKAKRGRARGALRRDSVAAAQTWLAQLRLAELRRQHDAHHAALRLSRLLGLRPHPLVGIIGAPPAPTVPEGSPALFKALQRKLERLSAVRLGRLRWLAARAKSREVRANRGAVLSLGGQLEVDSPLGTAGRLALGITWSDGGASARQRAALRAAEAAAKHNQEAARISAAHALEDALHGAHHSQARLTVLRDALVPALASQVSLLRKRVRAGEALQADLFTAQRRWLAGQLQLSSATGMAARRRLAAWLLLRALGVETPTEERP